MLKENILLMLIELFAYNEQVSIILRNNTSSTTENNGTLKTEKSKKPMK